MDYLVLLRQQVNNRRRPNGTNKVFFFRGRRRSERRFHDDGDGLDGDGHDDVLHAAQQLERGTTGQASR